MSNEESHMENQQIAPIETPAKIAPTETPASVTKGGGKYSEVAQILAVAVGAAVLGIGAYFFMHHDKDATSSSGERVMAVAASNANPSTPGAFAAGVPPTGFVVINTDVIVAQALKTMQDALKSNQSLLPHLGQIGAIVGKDISDQAQAYLKQGLVVYGANAFLAYPSDADRTLPVKDKVMADVQARLRAWTLESGQSATQKQPVPTVQIPEAPMGQAPGFEP
jgi:hypothetical protein